MTTLRGEINKVGQLVAEMIKDQNRRARRITELEKALDKIIKVEGSPGFELVRIERMKEIALAARGGKLRDGRIKVKIEKI